MAKVKRYGYDRIPEQVAWLYSLPDCSPRTVTSSIRHIQDSLDAIEAEMVRLRRSRTSLSRELLKKVSDLPAVLRKEWTEAEIRQARQDGIPSWVKESE